MSLIQTETQNQMVECPYDKSHRMLRKRLQQHLLKCRLNHPDTELQTCPFNKTHLIPEPEFVHHVTNCSDRNIITQYKYDAPDSSLDDDVDRVKHDPIECDENWDDTEVQDYDPRKYIETANVLRQPDFGQPAARKAFIKKERKRLGDYNSDDEREEKKVKKIKIKHDYDKPATSDEEADYVYNYRRVSTPPPPSNMAWYEDKKCKVELDEEPMTSKHLDDKGRKHKKRRHRSRGSREKDYSFKMESTLSVRSDDSPIRVRGLRRRSDSYSPARELEQRRRSANYSPKRFHEQSRYLIKYSPDREREHIRHVDKYNPYKVQEKYEHLGSYRPNRANEVTIHPYNDLEDYPLDEDPYYNGAGSSQSIQANGRIQYPLDHLHGRGAHRGGYPYLGLMRYDHSYHEY